MLHCASTEATDICVGVVLLYASWREDKKHVSSLNGRKVLGSI